MVTHHFCTNHLYNGYQPSREWSPTTNHPQDIQPLSYGWSLTITRMVTHHPRDCHHHLQAFQPTLTKQEQKVEFYPACLFIDLEISFPYLLISYLGASAHLTFNLSIYLLLWFQCQIFFFMVLFYRPPSKIYSHKKSDYILANLYSQLLKVGVTLFYALSFNTNGFSNHTF